MEIRYENYGEIITEQQAIIKGEYQKIFLENGTIKKIEEYDNSILEYIEYFIDSNENEQQIVPELTPLANIAVNITSAKDPLGDRFFRVSNAYREVVLVDKEKILYDQFDNVICIQCIDVNTDLPFLEEVVKFFYGLTPTEKTQALFEAQYNNDGSLSIIHYPDIDPLGKSIYYDATDFSDLVARFPDNPDLSYYLDATFEP